MSVKTPIRLGNEQFGNEMNSESKLLENSNVNVFINGIDSNYTSNGYKRLRSDSNDELDSNQDGKRIKLDELDSDLYETPIVNGTKMVLEADIKNENANKDVESVDSELKTDVSSLSDAKVKKPRKPNGPTEEEIQALRDKQLAYLNTFVNISLKYSQFLEKKIDVSEPSEKSAGKTPDSKKGHKNITQEMQYFVGELRPYQVEGVTWLTVLFENSVNGILADEMGLGKTIQIIALFCHLYERKVAGPFLIVAPLSTLPNWESEFARFAPKLPVVRLQGSYDERRRQMRQIKGKFYLDNRQVKPVVLCSYQTPLMESGFLQTFTWQYIVVDEGHRVKNPESQLSKELGALVSINRTLLTGTPLQNDIKELWALFHFLMPELFKDIEGFSTLLELADMKDTNKLLANEARTKVISTIHKVLAPFMLRREKKLVLNDIVPKKEIIVYCTLSEMQNYLYRITLQNDVYKLSFGKKQPENTVVTNGKRTRRSAQISYKENFHISNMGDEYDFEVIQRKLPSSSLKTGAFVPDKKNLPFTCPDCPYVSYLTMQNTMMMLKKIVNHPYLIWCPINPDVTARNEVFINEDLIKQSGKLMVLDAMLPKLKSAGHKVLVFSTLVMFMDMVEEMLIMRNYEYRRLDGALKYDNRNKCINEFMENSNVFLFLLSTRAGGLGLNLTAADTVIFLDRDWNPMVDLQAQDRCHRIGQTKPVMVYSLITKGTIDEVILNRGDMKRRLEKVVLQEGKFKTLKKTFDDNELKELEELLNNEEKLREVHSNGLMYSDEELNDILDRRELIQQMDNAKKN